MGQYYVWRKPYFIVLQIVMEYCGAGSVSDLMRITDKTLTEEQIAAIIKDALKVDNFNQSKIEKLKNYLRDSSIYILSERSIVI
jgi:hypothetical protein